LCVLGAEEETMASRPETIPEQPADTEPAEEDPAPDAVTPPAPGSEPIE
jgi:hypothetical protein